MLSRFISLSLLIVSIVFFSGNAWSTAGVGYTGYYSYSGTNCSTSGCHETSGSRQLFSNSNYIIDIVGATTTVNPGTTYTYQFEGINLQSGTKPVGFNAYFALSDADGDIFQNDTDTTVYTTSNQAVHNGARSVAGTSNIYEVNFRVNSGKPNGGSFYVYSCMNDSDGDGLNDSGDKIRCTSMLVTYRSDDDSISSLGMRNGVNNATITMDETFSSTDYAYNQTVASSVSSINLRPNVNADATYTIQINGTGTDYGNGDYVWSDDIPLNADGNTSIRIRVTAEDGDAQNYWIYVNRQSGDADLSSLLVSSSSLSPTFSSSTTAYTVTVPYSTTLYRVRPFLSDSESSMTVEGVSVASGAWSGYYGLTAGADYNFDINVTAEDTSVTKNYDVSVRRQNNVNTLSNLWGDGNTSSTLSLGTADSTDITVGYDDSTYRFFPSLTDSDASITISRNGAGASSITNSSWTGYYALDEGATTVFTFEVTPEDPTQASKTYTVNVYRESNDNTLSSLTGDGNVSSASSLGTATTINVTLDYTDSSYRFFPVLTDSDATMTLEQDGGGASSISNSSYTGYYSLTAGVTSVFSLVVTPEDTSEPTLTYTINVTRQNNDADLSALSISSGTLSPVFASGTTSYDVTVANAVSSVTFTPTASDSDYSSITVDGVSATSGVASSAVALAVGDNSIDIVVTAEDSSYNKTYTVVVRRLSNDADLSALSVTGSTLSPSFNAAITSYTAPLPYGTSSATINATVSDTGNAGYSVSGDTGLSTGDNAATVQVTAEDGTTKDYDINLRVQNNDATLSALSITEGTISPVFSSGTTSYTVDVPAGTSSVTVNASTTDANAGYIVSGNTGLSTGDNIVTVSVTAEDSSYTQDYTITVHVLSNDADLAALSVTEGALSPAFSAATTAYDVNVPNGTTAVTVSATVSDVANAGYSVSGDTGLTTGDNTVTVQVTAEDGTTKDYVLTVRVLSNDADLSALSISGATLSPVFSSGTLSYDTSVPYGTTNVSVLATVADTGNAGYSVSGDTGLTTGDNTVTVQVTAEDGTTRDYTITVRVLNNNADLSALSISGATLSPVFSSGTTSYTTSVAPGTASVSVSATLSDSNAGFTVSGDSGLTTGDNIVTVQVTAEDGTTVKDYTITVKVLNDDPSLSNLVIGGTSLSPAFSSGVYSYNASVTSGTSSVTVTPTTTDANANAIVSGDTGLVTGDNTVTVSVTAEDGVTTQDYTVIVRVLDNDADLSALSVSGYSLSPGFSPSTTSYDISVPFGTGSVSVSATTADGNAGYVVSGDSGLTTGDNTVTVQVTAEDGVTTKDYTITVRVLNNVATLSALSMVEGALSPVFASGTYSYSANVAAGTASVSVSATTTDANASYVVLNNTGLSTGDNTVTVRVTAEDGTTQQDYTITVDVLSNNANLSALSITEGSISPAFNPSITAYSVSVPNGTAAVTVSATVADTGNAGYTVSGDSGLSVGDNTVTVQVTAEDGTTKDYDITVRVLSNNADLSALSISGTTLSPSFSAAVTAYTANVAPGTSSVSVSATVADTGNAGYSVSGDSGLSLGNNTVTVQVTAEDGTTRDYVVTVRVLDNDADLSALSIAGATLSPGFSSGTTAYTTSVASGTTNVSVSATTSDTNANYSVSGDTGLSTGDNVVTVQVTAEDGVTTKDYTITVRVLSADADLSALSLSEASISPVFSSGTTAYTATVGNLVTSVTVNATTSDGNAGYVVSGDTGLSVGSGNTVTVTVTAEDGVTTKDYTITVTRTQSSDADLSALVLSNGGLSPAFAAGTTSYTASVSNAISSITVTATVNEANATLTVDGNAESSGVASAPVALSVGVNAIPVEVTAQDGTTKTYTINVTRAANGDAELSNLVLSSGSLSPSFAQATTSYTASVSYATTSITVTPTTAVGTSTVTVEGVSVSSGNPSGSIPLSVGANSIETEVTAQDGITKLTYTVIVNRAGNNDADLSALSVSGYSLSPAFSAGQTSYNISVPTGTASVSVSATTNDVNASYSVSGNTSLSTGDNTVTVQVTAEDGTTTQDYTITVRVLANNADLSALSIAGASLTPSFSSAVTSYTTSVPAGTTSVAVSATNADANAGYAVSGNTGLVTGDNTVTVTATAENGTTTKDYTVTVRVLSDDADLSALSVTGATLSPAFNAAVTSYNVTVPNGTTSVSVPATTNDSNAGYTVSGNTGLVDGDNTVTVQVTAEDATTTKDYVITVRVVSANADLSALSLLEGSLSPAFDPAITSYDVSVPNGTTAVTVSSTTDDSNASVLVSGDSGLVFGDNTVTVQVTAEDGTTTKDYTLTVRVLSNDADLSALSISEGSISPVFAAGTTSYNVSVAPGTTAVTVSASTNDVNAAYTVSGDTGLVTGDNTVTVQVTAEDGTTSKDYNITVRVLSDDADLSLLSIAGASLSPAFAANTISYDTTVSSGTSSVTVTATPNDSNASVLVSGDTGLVAGDNTLTVQVTAEDGVTQKTYTVTVRVSNSNANLSALSITGATLSPVFDALTTSYSTSVPAGTTSVTVSATTQDGNSTYVVSGNTGLVTGDNTVTVQVTAEDGVTVKDYTVTVRVLSNDADLSALSLAGASLSPAFNAATTSYTATLPSGTTSVAVTATTSDINANAVVSGDTGLVTGDNLLTISVTAEDGTTTRDYTVTVRVLADDADLSVLSIAGATLSPAFSAATTSYTTSVAAGTSSVAVTATANDANASVLVAGDTGLVTGDNTVTATVTAEDGTTIKVYSVTVRVLSNDADLSALSVAGGTLDPVFASATTSYTVAMPSGTTSVSISATSSDGNAAVVVAGDTGLVQGDNAASVTVTAEDGTVKVYNLTIRVSNNNADLSALSIAEGSITPVFDSATTAYNASVAPGTTSVTVSATTDDGNAGFVVSGDSGLVTGDNTVTVTVTAENGITTQDYTITVRVLSDDADLASLSLAEGAISPAFDPTTTAYTLAVAPGTTSVNVSAAASDSNAGVVISGDSGLVSGDNTVNIQVTAEDGVTVKNYAVTVRVLSANADLSALSIAEGSISPVFAAATTAYSVSVPSATSAVTVTATAADTNASVVVSGDSGLVTGDNTVTVTVTAEDGVTVKAYSITVRVLSSDADLASLSVAEGAISPAFAAVTTSYDVSLSPGTSAITVNASASDSNATVLVAGDSGLVTGDNTVTVTVTAEDGVTVKVYTITARVLDSNTLLSALSVSGASLSPVFNPATTSYTVDLPNGTTTATVSATTDDSNANYAVSGDTGLVTGDNTITVTVTAEDGVSTQDYTITARVLSNDSSLSSLAVTGQTLAPVFAPATLNYSVAVPYATTSIAVTAATNDSNASYLVAGGSSLTVGDNTVIVTVTAEDGSSTDYEITVTRAASPNADLTGLDLGAASLTPAFGPAITSYTSSVANTVTSIAVTADVAEPGAILTVNGVAVASGTPSSPIALAIGNNTVVVEVTAPAGNTKTYTVQVDRVASPDASLAGLSTSEGSLIPGFDPVINFYTVQLANSVSSATITPVVNDVNATVTVDGAAVSSGAASQPLALAVGDNDFIVEVTAQDGVTTLAYTVRFKRAPSSDSSLAGLALSAGNLSPAFDPATTAYNASVSNADASLVITPTSTHPNATISVDGVAVSSGVASAPIALSVGSNSIVVEVTAEDGATLSSYTIVVDRALSSDATLSSLTSSAGVLSPAFDPATSAYTVAVANSVSSATLNAVVAEANASLTVDGVAVASGADSQAVNLSVGVNVIAVVVTAQDGTSTNTYNVSIDRAPSANADLAGLLLDVGSLAPAFDSAVTSYNVSVANSDSSISLTSSLAEPNATIMVNGVAVADGVASSPVALQVGSNVITVAVTAQDGTTVKNYTVNVDRAPSSDADLASLFVSAGVMSPAFDAAVTSYTVTAPHAIEQVTLTPAVNEPNASITVAGVAVNSGEASAAQVLLVGSNPVDVVVTAEDGTTVKTYTLDIVREPSDDAALSILSLSEGSLSPGFDGTVLSYNASVGNDVESVVVTVSSRDENALVTVNGATPVANNSAPISLLVGSNNIDVVVTAEDGATVQTYSVVIDRAASDDAELSGLLVSDGSLDPVFNAALNQYRLEVTNDVTSLQFTPQLSEPNASVLVDGVAVADGVASQAITLAVGETPIDIVVTAEDGTSTETYSIIVDRALSSDATLASLDAGITFTPIFDPTTLAYNASVANAVSSLDVLAVLAEANAQFTVNGLPASSGVVSPVALIVGSNTVVVEVTAEDGTTVNSYTLTVDRAPSADATLASITPSIGELSPVFSASQHDYTVTVGNGVIDFSLQAIPAESNAQMLFEGLPLDAGVLSAAVSLQVGNNLFDLQVTAQDGVSTETYTVTVNRLMDADSDNDGIPDVVEGVDSLTDTDGDGIADYLDPDSDNDGIPDAVEGGASGIDADGDGIDNTYDVGSTRGNDSNGDGIDDDVLPPDTDGDGVADYRDPDADGDGVPDVIEGQSSGTDSDGDGIDDGYDVDQTGGIDLNNDGVDDAVNPPDSETDGVADYLDTDSDNDGVSDGVEAGVSGVDTDGDGIDDSYDVDQTGGVDANGDGVDDNTRPTDSNGDGIPDYASAGIDTDRDGIIDAIERTGDSDGDGLPDFLDLDSDNDGIPDTVEGIRDIDGDGIPNYLDLDSDGDGLSDQFEGDLNSDTDALPDFMDSDSDNDGINDGDEGILDTDQDGTPDYRDGSIDEDQDGLPDIIEGVGDFDLDGIPDFRDPDSDNDGVTDLSENGLRLDSDGDGIADVFDVDQTGGSDANGDGIDDNAQLPDQDLDGIPNIYDLNADNDGVPDSVEGNADTDGDGIVDALDLDSDNDGIGDNIEGVADSDGDGIPDRLDLDSDNDGIPDVSEAGLADIDGDGLKDAGQATLFNSALLPDADLDGIPDFLEIDSNNDGIFDLVTAGYTGYDPDNNGRIDNAFAADSDNDGVKDVVDAEPYAFSMSGDLDGDGVDSVSDGDDDNDGVPDVLEGNVDSDGDGLVDRLDTDSDNDGIPDTLEAVSVALSGNDIDADGIDDAVDVDFTGGPDNNADGVDDRYVGADSDGDGIPDRLDADSDNDGIPDSDEGGVDSDGDGLIDSRDPDADNDGIPDSSEGVMDSDNDGLPDYIDTDSDGDGIPDSLEMLQDTDLDLILDYLDLDSDGDGVHDLLEGFADIDGDGLENFRDPDSDNDGIADADEDGDFNNDGINDRLQDNREVSTSIRGGGSIGLLALMMLLLLVFARFQKPGRGRMLLKKHLPMLGCLLAAALPSTELYAADGICDVKDGAELSFSIPGCWYVGAGFGQSYLEPDIKGSTWDVDGDTDSMFKLEVGYQLLPQLYIQATYADLGSAGLENVNPLVTGDEPVDYQVFSATAAWVFLLDLPLATEFYLKGGLATIDNGGSDVDYDKQDSLQITAGAGLQWQFNSHWFGRMEFDSYSDDAQAFSLVLLRSVGG